MNPSHGQQSEGIVIGTKKSGGFILVKTRIVKPVQRNPKKYKLSSLLVIIVLNNKLFLYLLFFSLQVDYALKEGKCICIFSLYMYLIIVFVSLVCVFIRYMYLIIAFVSLVFFFTG